MTDPEIIVYREPAAVETDLLRMKPSSVISRGSFQFPNHCSREDFEWNHLDQEHRPHIHNTYLSASRLYVMKNSAVSLTRVELLPGLGLNVLVVDVKLKPGLYEQVYTVGGSFFIHTRIRIEKEAVYVDWRISSHWLLRPFHYFLHRKLQKMNQRQNEEDIPVRQRRAALREAGYDFKTSHDPDFLSCNDFGNNTVYPRLQKSHEIGIAELSAELKSFSFEGIEFRIRKVEDEIQIWPAVCPHDGGPLENSLPDGKCRLRCPWHGLSFQPLKLSGEEAEANFQAIRFRRNSGRIEVFPT